LDEAFYDWDAILQWQNQDIAVFRHIFSGLQIAKHIGFAVPWDLCSVRECHREEITFAAFRPMARRGF